MTIPTNGPGTEDVLTLAAIIREIDSGNRLGAAALAEAILSHPCSRWLPATPPSHQEAFDIALADAMAQEEVIEKIDQLASDINSLRQMINLPPGVRPAKYIGVINGEKITVWNDKENEFIVSNCYLNLAKDGTWKRPKDLRSVLSTSNFIFSSLSAAWNTALKSLETNHDPN